MIRPRGFLSVPTWFTPPTPTSTFTFTPTFTLPPIRCARPEGAVGPTMEIGWSSVVYGGAVWRRRAPMWLYGGRTVEKAGEGW